MKKNKPEKNKKKIQGRKELSSLAVKLLLVILAKELNGSSKNLSLKHTRFHY